MLKRRIAVIAIGSLTIIAPAALATGRLSGTYRTTITSPQSIKGVWKVSFHSGVQQVTWDGRPASRGTYKISGSTITFRRSTAGGCHLAGKYHFALSGKTLKFTRISDNCPNRPEILSRTFTKV
jgi:hypothetical protein